MLAEAGGRPIDVLLYVPSPAYLELARLLADEGAGVTYDAVLDWVLAPPRFHPPRNAHRSEASLPASWRIVSDNPHVARDLEARLGRSPSPSCPPRPTRRSSPMTGRQPPGARPSSGDSGSIHAEVDVDLLCAASRAGLRVEAVGPVEDAAAAQRLLNAGVVMKPGVSIGVLPATIDHWQVAILAYRGPRAATITPAKLLNALVGFQVAARGIAVPEQLARGSRPCRARTRRRSTCWPTWSTGRVSTASRWRRSTCPGVADCTRSSARCRPLRCPADGSGWRPVLLPEGDHGHDPHCLTLVVPPG